MDFEWIFQGYLFFGSNGCRLDKTYEEELQAVVEQQYLPKVPVPIQHMAIFIIQWLGRCGNSSLP